MDTTGEAGSATCPYHWSTAILALSKTHMTRVAPMIKNPQARRCHSQAAATAISGSHSARSWTYPGLVGKPVPRRNAACSPLVSAGTIRPSQTSVFSVTITHT